MTDIMQGENANSFEAYWEILKQLQQILQKSGHVIRNAEKREQRIAMLYHQIQSEDDLYAYSPVFLTESISPHTGQYSTLIIVLLFLEILHSRSYFLSQRYTNSDV